MCIFKAWSQNSEPRNRAKNRSRAAIEDRKCFKMWSVLVSDHKNAFGIEFGLFWQFLIFLIFGVLRLNSEPGSSAFWPKLEVLPSCRARENRIKHRLWWFQCAGDRKIEPSGHLWLSTSPNPTLAFFRVLAKSPNRKCRFIFSLETIFEHFPASETFCS